MYKTCLLYNFLEERPDMGENPACQMARFLWGTFLSEREKMRGLFLGPYWVSFPFFQVSSVHRVGRDNCLHEDMYHASTRFCNHLWMLCPHYLTVGLSLVMATLDEFRSYLCGSCRVAYNPNASLLSLAVSDNREFLGCA